MTRACQPRARGRRPVAVLWALGAASASAGTSAAHADGRAGSSPADDRTPAEEYYESVEELTGAEREEKLVADARAAGGLTVYSGLPESESVAEAFEERYDIDVEFYWASSEDVLQRALQEAESADGLRADIVYLTAQQATFAANESMFSPFSSAAVETVEPDAMRDGWIGTTSYEFVVAWNTDRIGPEDEPTSYEDLADPRFEGTIVLEVGDYDWYAALYQYYEDQGRPTEEIDDMFEAIADNANSAQGHSAVTEFLSAGQFALSPTVYRYQIDQAAEAGAPLTWQGENGPIEPVVRKYAGFGLSRSAGNPAAAVLWADFELTDAQEIYASLNLSGTVEGVATTFPEGLETIPTPDAELTGESGQEWAARYDELVGG